MTCLNGYVTKDELEKSLGKIKEEIIDEFRLFLERVKYVLSSNDTLPKRETSLPVSNHRSKNHKNLENSSKSRP